MIHYVLIIMKLDKDSTSSKSQIAEIIAAVVVIVMIILVTVALILIVIVVIRRKQRKKVCFLHNIILLLLIVLLQGILPMTLNNNSHNPVNIELDIRSDEIIEDDIDMKREEDSGCSSHMSSTQSSVVKEITYATLSEMKSPKPSSPKPSPKEPSPKVPPVKYEDIDFKATQVGLHTEFIVW